jgi:hypothetical protein
MNVSRGKRCNVKNKQAVEKLALSLINQWFSSHPSARIQ